MRAKKIRATVHYEAIDLVNIRTEDGGVASLYYNGEHWITDYYQNRWYEKEIDWDKLGEGKGQYREWDEHIVDITMDMIIDALNWLVMSTQPIEFEITEHVNTEPPHIAKEPKTDKT